MDAPLARFTVPLEVTIRPCQAEDLRAMEWFGLFTEHREIFQEAFARQERGEVVMLVADAGGFPIGQVWIDLTLRKPEPAGVLWAVRVFPFLQNLGIGAKLVAAAERVLRERGFRIAELGVERVNPAARRFYERLGYRVTGEETGEYTYTRPDGTFIRIPTDEWIMRKSLCGEGAEDGDGPGGEPGGAVDAR